MRSERNCELYRRGNCLLRPDPEDRDKFLPCVGCSLQHGLESDVAPQQDQLQEVNTIPDQQARTQDTNGVTFWGEVLEERGDRVATQLGLRD